MKRNAGAPEPKKRKAAGQSKGIAAFIAVAVLLAVMAFMTAFLAMILFPAGPKDVSRSDVGPSSSKELRNITLSIGVDQFHQEVFEQAVADLCEGIYDGYVTKEDIAAYVNKWKYMASFFDND